MFKIATKSANKMRSICSAAIIAGVLLGAVIILLSVMGQYLVQDTITVNAEVVRTLEDTNGYYVVIEFEHENVKYSEGFITTGVKVSVGDKILYAVNAGMFNTDVRLKNNLWRVIILTAITVSILVILRLSMVPSENKMRPGGYVRRSSKKAFWGKRSGDFIQEVPDEKEGNKESDSEKN